MTGRRPDGGHRVAVTGIGVKTPAGNDLESVHATVLAGRSTAAPAPHLAELGLPVRIACQVPAFDLDAYLPRRESRQSDRATHLLLCAAADALADAPPLADFDPYRVGVLIGTGIGGLPSMEEVTLGYGHRLDHIPVFTVPRTMSNAPACRLALRHGLHGPCTTVSTACASGATALGEAARKIRYGEVDAVVAGGVDAALTAVVVGAFARTRAMSTRNDQPAHASRPFDAERDGFVMGEGAAVLLLERWEAAAARGARIYGELSGFADTCDAHHVVAPHPDGEAAARCMELALADAGFGRGDVAHISAHGTSTPRNDTAEARAVQQVFGDSSPPVTAPKGVTGHLIGGSGALEAALALRCAVEGAVPPIANLGASPEADLLDLVGGDMPRVVAPGPVLSNSFGFGGQNTCLVVSPPP